MDRKHRREVVETQKFHGKAGTGDIIIETLRSTGGNDETVQVNCVSGSQFEFADAGRLPNGIYFRVVGEWEIREIVGALQRVYGDCKEWVRSEDEESEFAKECAKEYAANNHDRTDIDFP